MAVCFELVLNLGRDDAATRAMRSAVDGRLVTIRGDELPLAGPFVTQIQGEHGYAEFTVVVPGIGYGGPTGHLHFDPRTLTDDEISDVGRQLFDLVRELPDFLVAAIGWDPEARVDVEELRSDLAAGWPLPDGVVLASHVAQDLGVVGATEPFVPDYVRVPYRGDRSLWRDQA